MTFNYIYSYPSLPSLPPLLPPLLPTHPLTHCCLPFVALYRPGSMVSVSTVRLTVTEGKYRMVRRILHNAGHSVIALHRMRYGNTLLIPPCLPYSVPHSYSPPASLAPCLTHTPPLPPLLHPSLILIGNIVLDENELSEGEVAPITEAELEWAKRWLKKA